MPTAEQPLDAAVVRQHFDALAARISQATGTPTTAEAVAAGALQIAVASMANAIKRISVARGYDVTGYTLQCFGGAGGQHACAVADALGMQQVLIHPLAGVLSAYGMGLADQIAMREASIELPLDDAGLHGRAPAPGHAGRRRRGRGAGARACRAAASAAVQRLQLRYQGTDTALPVALAALQPAALRAAFEAGLPPALRLPACRAGRW